MESGLSVCCGPDRRAKAARRRGATLVELMIAVVILSTAILAGISSFQYIVTALHRSRTKTIANNVAQEKMEVLKNLSYFQLLVSSDTATDTNYSPAVVYDNAAYGTERISLWGYPVFTRAVFVAYADMSGASISTVSYTSSDTGIKAVTVYLLWKEGSTYKKIELRSLYANPAAASLNSGFTGAVTIAGTSTAVPGAKIQVAGNPNWHGTADASGSYSFEVSKGSYSLICSSSGFYTTVTGNIYAPQGSNVTRNFSLLEIATGTISGGVWISTNILVSQVIVSSTDGNSFHQEWVELYNPTTWTWTIGSGSDQVVELLYRKNPSGLLRSVSLDYSTTTIASKGYYLIASTSPLWVNGASTLPDATYKTSNSGYPDLMSQCSEGGVGIRWANSAVWIDRLAWSNSGSNAPADLAEGTALSVPAGLWSGEQIRRYTDAGTFTSTLGRAYDTDNNSRNSSYIVGTSGCPSSTLLAITPPNNSGVTHAAVSGRPAFNALISANDGLSMSTIAVPYNLATFPYASFVLPRVTTGTWTLTITSGIYKVEISSVSITQGTTTSVPNAATVPAWDAAGYNDGVLTSTTSGGYVRGYVYGAGADYSVALSGILVEANGFTTRTLSSGYYELNVDTGTVIVNANYGSDDSDYMTASAQGTVNAGETVFLPADPYFHLAQGGTITGHVTTGTGALPNIVVKAARGTVVYEATTDSTGRFYISASTSSSAYTLSPSLDPQQAYTSAPADPLTATLGSPGASVFAGTFTVTGGLGTISGTVKLNSASITTGVLVVASVGAVSDPPVAIYSSTAPALSSPFYTASSQADGTYALNARAGTYNMRAWYPDVDVNSGAVTYTSKTKSGVAVTAGQTTSGQDFTWP